MKRLFSLSFFIIIYVNVFCQILDKSDKSLVPGDGEKKVVVKGIGDTRDQALKNGFENAVNEAIGALISTETRIENDVLIKDEIRLYSKGFIKTYKILSESGQNSNYEMLLAAIVSERQLFESLKAKGVTVPYSTAGLFSKIDEWDNLKKLEIRMASALFENSPINLSESIFDYSVSIGDPSRNGQNYTVNLEVTAVPNQNYFRYIPEFRNLLSELAFDQRMDLHIKDRNAYVNFEYVIITKACQLEGRRRITDLKELNGLELIRMNDARITVGTEEGSVEEASEYTFMGGSNRGRTPYNVFSKDYAPYILVFSEGKNEGGARRKTIVFSFMSNETIALILRHFNQMNNLSYQILVRFLDGSERTQLFNSDKVNQIVSCNAYDLINGVRYGAGGSIFEGKVYDNIVQLPYKGLSLFLDPELGAKKISVQLNFSESDLKKIKEIQINPLKSLKFD